MSFLSRGKGNKFPPNASFRLTQEGRSKLENFGADAKSRILMALETQGTSDIDEISQESGVRKGQVERLIPAMVRGGYIQYVGASADEVI